MTRTRCRPRLRGLQVLAARYRAGLFVLLLAVPVAAAAVARGPSSEPGLTTLVGLPLLGDGRLPAWMVLALYSGVVTAPLLAWNVPAVETSAPDFSRRSLHFPHALALGLALVTLTAMWSLPTWASAIFWVATSMAAAHVGALVLGQRAWVVLLLVTLLVLSLCLQGRLAVHRTPAEATCAAAILTLLAGVTAVLQRRRRRA